MAMNSPGTPGTKPGKRWFFKRVVCLGPPGGHEGSLVGTQTKKKVTGLSFPPQKKSVAQKINSHDD